jgi:hypothetical protein
MPRVGLISDTHGLLRPEALRALLAYAWPGNAREAAGVLGPAPKLVLAMALEVAIVMANRPGVLCPVGGFVVITRHRVPAPATGVGKFATFMARKVGRDTASAAFEYYIPDFECYTPRRRRR